MPYNQLSENSVEIIKINHASERTDKTVFKQNSEKLIIDSAFLSSYEQDSFFVYDDFLGNDPSDQVRRRGTESEASKQDFKSN